jgi:hypothetical protein
MKIRLVEAELFHADRRTDVIKPTVAFRNFANVPKNGYAENAKYAGPNKYSLNTNSKHPTSNKRTFRTDTYNSVHTSQPQLQSPL